MRSCSRPRSRQSWLAPLAALCLFFFGFTPRAEATDGGLRGPVVATAMGTEIRTHDPEELRYLILSALTDRYAEEQGIAVTPEDIDAYLVGMARLAEKDRKRREAREDEIQRRLASTTLGEDERKALTSELDALRQLQGDLDQSASSEAEETQEARQTRRAVAAAFIRQWKIDRALYLQYGGRLIYQQGGAEPLDAYCRFLEEQQRKGSFAILDQDLQRAFWRYFRDDATHSFYPSGSEEETRVFQSPWWLHH